MTILHDFVNDPPEDEGADGCDTPSFGVPEAADLLALIRLAAMDGYNKKPVSTVDEWMEECKKRIFLLYLAGRNGGVVVADAVHLIAAERARQVSEEGWDARHDDMHTKDELALAAAAYAIPERRRKYTTEHYVLSENGGRDLTWWTPQYFPWDEFKPTPDDRIRELVKAGALIAAEIERLARIAAREIVSTTPAPTPTGRGDKE